MMTNGLTKTLLTVTLAAGCFAAGAATQSALLKDADVLALSTKASPTAADHRRLAAHYRLHATEHQADAKTHEAIATAARKRSSDDDAWDLARNAAHYAEHSREAAEAMNELAVLHEEIAKRTK